MRLPDARHPSPQDAATADVSLLADRALYARWQPDPLRCAASPVRLARCDMAATLVANASCAAAPAARALPRAYDLFAARAYVHQYAAHGLADADFEAAFARVEDVLAAYRA